MRINSPWLNRKNKSMDENNSPKILENSFLKAGQILKRRRLEYGISRNDLGVKTRISTTVLEAIEEGWVNKLPERAYLASMLIILENQLNLERGSLKGALIETKEAKEATIVRTFIPESIDLFTTWQGSAAYISLMLLSILLLNNHQRNIAISNNQTISPIMQTKKHIASSKQVISNQESKQPINQIPKTKRFTPWIVFKNMFNKALNLNKTETLIINLINPSKLTVKELKGGYQANLSRVSGEIKLNITPPVVITVNPPPTSKDSITWKGSRYIPSSNDEGVYRLDENFNKEAASSKLLPQKIPRSP